jgi:hypothetical protein
LTSTLLRDPRAALATAVTNSGLILPTRGTPHPGAYGGYAAEILLDSVSPSGARITTMRWRYPRFIHAEVMTYRMFSRNTSSSRAIPILRMVNQVWHNPAFPVYWGKNQSGMQAREELRGWRRQLAIDLWYAGRTSACLNALAMYYGPGLHKQIANRPLEAWMWIEAVITASPVALENCWRQRCHPDAQPEFRYVANLARSVYNSSMPTERTLHAPLMGFEDELHLKPSVIKQVSTARAARTSYLVHGRKDRSIEEDQRLYARLHLGSPEGEVPHTSPAEHCLTAHPDPKYRSGNVFGWIQHREEVDPYFVHWDDEAFISWTVEDRVA